MQNPILKILFSIFGIININVAMAQYTELGTSSCTVNVNDPTYSWTNNYNDIKRAVFKFIMTGPGAGGCTGVLLNQWTPESQQQQYFITALHCFDGTDPNTKYYFLFNYQSKDANNSSVPEENQGYNDNYGNPLKTDGVNVTDGYQCYFTSTITVIDTWEEFDPLALEFGGDLALCRIDEPIPPHFNVFYAGWNTSAAYSLTSADFNLSFAPFTNIGHPNEDIKKIDRMDVVALNNNLLETGCTIITTIVDFIINFLFGWAIGHHVNISVICNYVDFPFYISPATQVGAIQPGSSGSPLISDGGQFMGCLSTSLFGPCTFINDMEFSKFKDFYRFPDVYNNLNPSGDWTAENIGISGRNANCYDYLNLSGDYYPLGNYQTNNHLELHANHDINVNSPLHIHTNTSNNYGSDYTFSAGGNIVLGNGFTVDYGSKFTAIPGNTSNNCDRNSYSREQSPLGSIANIIASLPKSKQFDISEYFYPLKVFPNPTSGLFNVSVLYDKDFTVQLYDLMSKSVYENFSKSNGLLSTQTFSIDISNYPSGLYIVKVIASDGKVWSDKVIKVTN